MINTYESEAHESNDSSSAPDDLYDEFTLRNRPLINEKMQLNLRKGLILFAGCGSTGGAAIEPLVRLGAERIRLCEPGTFELNNLNRQSATWADLDRNKAEVLRDRAKNINPAVCCEVNTEGITPSNVNELISGVRVVVDGVDVTTMSGWQAKYQLHEAAARLGIPVIVGYDMSGVQYIRAYQYRPGDRPFDGAITQQDLRANSHWAVLKKAIPLRAIPIDLLEGLSRMKAEEGFPQLTYTALMFGAVASRMTLSLMCGDRVANEVTLDLHAVVRPPTARLRARVLDPFLRARLIARVVPQLIPDRGNVKTPNVNRYMEVFSPGASSEGGEDQGRGHDRSDPRR